MSEETQDHNDGTWSGLKKTIIGLVTTVVLGAGGVITNKLIGEEEATPVQQAAPVININNTQTQQQAAGGGKTVIIKEKSSAPAPQTAPAPKPKKKEGDEFKEEAPKW